jgi:hypothetical protein
MSARRTENSGTDRARHQPVNWRRSSVQASRVNPRYPARNPASASRSASVNTGWTGTREEEWDMAAIGAPSGTAGTREAGPPRVPAVNDARNVRRPTKTSYVTVRS